MNSSTLRSTTRRLTYRMIAQLPAPFVNHFYEWRNAWRPSNWADAPFFLIHVPKAAGISISAAVNRPDPGHILLSHMQPELRERLAGKPCLAVVRDPAARLVSTFNYIHSTRAVSKSNLVNSGHIYKSIDEFIEQYVVSGRVPQHYFFRPAWDYVSDAKKVGAQVTLVNFKELGSKVPAFLRSVGIPIENLPNENTSNIKFASTADIGTRAAALIRNAYRDDYEMIDRL